MWVSGHEKEEGGLLTCTVQDNNMSCLQIQPQKGEPMKSKRTSNVLFSLITLTVILVSGAASAAETGYVVGRVYLKIDGFQNVNREIIESAKVEIAHVKDHKITTINTTTDKQGYFVLQNQSLDGLYFPYKIQGSVINIPVPSAVPDPDPSKGVGGLLYYMFSSQHEAAPPIIDCGETIILLKADGKLAVQRRYKKNHAILDFSKDKPYENVQGTYGYPGLEYYAKSGSGSLKSIANEALLDRQSFAHAELLKKEADELKKGDKNAAADKYREAILAYPFYGDAYIALVSVLKSLKKKEEAIELLEKAQRNCPASDDVKFELGKLYVDTDQASKAVALLESFLKNNADNLSVYENLAKAYQAADRQVDADKLWQKAIASIKSDSRFREAADFYKEIGRLDKAIPLYEEYLAAKPKDRWAFGYLAEAYLAAGRADDGDLLWQRGLLELDNESKYYNAGHFYDKAGKPEKAIPCYEKYLAAKPTARLRYSYLAMAYLAADRYAEGDALWQRGLREADDDGKYYNAAEFYQNAGKNDKALPLFQKYERAKPDDNWAKIYLLRSYIANCKVSEAVETANQCNKSIIYWNAYRALMASHQYDQAEQMLLKALATHSDGTLSRDRSNLEDQIANLSTEKKAAKHFLAYLKAIQDDGDHDNWKGKPYDLYVKRNPLAK